MDFSEKDCEIFGYIMKNGLIDAFIYLEKRDFEKKSQCENWENLNTYVIFDRKSLCSHQ